MASPDLLDVAESRPPPCPPPLPISLREHKKAIGFEWTMLLLDSCVVPLTIFHVSWYGTSLPPSTIFAIITTAFGFVSLLRYLIRLRRLTRKDDWARPLGAGRGSLDTFQHGFTFGTIVVSLILIVGTITDDPDIRLLSMPTPTVLLMVGLYLLVVDTYHVMGFRLPFRMSSLDSGTLARPGIYTIIEDVVAVDGGAGQAYRTALDARYRASPIFRQMLRQLSFFWSIGAVVVAGVCTAIIFTAPVEVAFGVGWGLPWVWGALGTIVTVQHVQGRLAAEELEWAWDAKYVKNG